MNYLISVIVPVYNVERWVNQCIESIVNQTYKNLEIILVDDGSTDMSPFICDEWARKDKRIKVLHKKNGGLSSSRNAALDICTGDYIGFIDSDDYIDENMYSYMLKRMIDNNVKVVSCGIKRFTEDKFERYKGIDKEKIYGKRELIEGLYYYKKEAGFSVCSKLFSADLFSEIRFPVGINSEDCYVLPNIYMNIDNMLYIEKDFYFYRYRMGSITTREEIDEHSYDKILISDMIMEKTRKKNPCLEKDAKVFCAMTRFSVYQDLMSRKHTKDIEKKWSKDIRKHIAVILFNKKINILFKIKYTVCAFSIDKYMKIKSRIESRV